MEQAPMSEPTSLERRSRSSAPDVGTLRRAVACAYTLLDEIERAIVRAPDDPASRAGVTHQAAEELMRLAHLLTPPRGTELLQDAE
jgi:hypothetical protein